MRGVLGVEVAAVKAVAAVEGSGRCFGADGRPIMRYELHTFNQATGAKYATTHPHLAAGYSAGLLAHPGGQAGEYRDNNYDARFAAAYLRFGGTP